MSLLSLPLIQLSIYLISFFIYLSEIDECWRQRQGQRQTEPRRRPRSKCQHPATSTTTSVTSIFFYGCRVASEGNRLTGPSKYIKQGTELT